MGPHDLLKQIFSFESKLRDLLQMKEFTHGANSLRINRDLLKQFFSF